MTFDSIISLSFVRGFSQCAHLVAIEDSWPPVDPGWLLDDFWPQQCITRWSGVLPTKFGGIRLSEQFDPWLTPVDPCMTFDPGITLLFGQGFFLLNLVKNRAFLNQLDLWMTFDVWWGYGPVSYFIPCQVSAPYLKAWQRYTAKFTEHIRRINWTRPERFWCVQM